MQGTNHEEELIRLRRQIYSAIVNFMSYNTEVGIPLSYDELKRLSKLLTYLQQKLTTGIYALRNKSKEQTTYR